MRRHPETIWRAAPGFVALARPGGEILTVTGPAAGLWELLEQGTTPAEAAEVLAGRHGATVDVVLADLEPLWDRLRAEGLLDG
ncbi:hypothetical protein GCM10022415_31860 [Knoellia locipacati]|uniref:PqqD family protein n=1 Tax=Knoellia locipacati TaxID=882824 RepID=A0A512T3L0_9MICO|nr:PqqD family protein [Knoellia locipacati]GEQ14810.1 hypothetical protein KLO01_28570 [Knoellia locipacati]